MNNKKIIARYHEAPSNVRCEWVCGTERKNNFLLSLPTSREKDPTHVRPFDIRANMAAVGTAVARSSATFSVAFLGLGRMGFPMAGRLAEKYSVLGWNRSVLKEFPPGVARVQELKVNILLYVIFFFRACGIVELLNLSYL